MRYLQYLFLLSLPVIIVTLLFLEGGLRVFGYTPWYANRLAYIPSQNKEIIYELKPGFNGLYAGVPISINSYGLRGREFPNQKTNSTFRVIVVGDSIAFGQGVRRGETLADQLEKQLQPYLDLPVEVLNCGVPGYNTRQEYNRFMELVPFLKPQVVLLVYYHNDTDTPNFQVKDNVVVTAGDRTGFYGKFEMLMRKHSALYNLAWTRWQGIKNPTYTIIQYRKILTEKFDDDNPRWKISKSYLSKLISIAKDNSIRIIVIPFPELSGLDSETYPFEEYIRKVCGVARENGVECLNVVPVLQHTDIQMRVSSVEHHPSAEVYKKIAEMIVKMLH